MQTTNGYRSPNDIGGPTDINEGYRWNVPVLTYAFDQAFLDYFGSNGVAAVESAIQILNDLPPASAISLTNLPLDAIRVNHTALAQNLTDLKSTALALMLEQMGLAAPTRNVFDLRRWDPVFLTNCCEPWPSWVIPDYITERNFDPETLAPSHYVNGYLFTGDVSEQDYELWQGVYEIYSTNMPDVLEVAMDQDTDYSSAVADWRNAAADFPHQIGLFYQWLTFDDAGGLRYLLSSNHVSLEKLLPGVHGQGSNATSYVDVAPRPGVEKITFVRQNYDSVAGKLVSPWTNRFTDSYITNNTLMHQQLERVTTQPDFLFCVADTIESGFSKPPCLVTGTSNWWNSAGLSGSTNLGPGLIQPPIRVTFDKRGQWVETYDWIDAVGLFEYRWASFDGSTNAPVIYPQVPPPSPNDRLTVRLWLHNGTDFVPDIHFTWDSPVPMGAEATLQTSTNLLDWVSVMTAVNHGGPIDWNHLRSLPQRFFRIRSP